jgi:hypothetical protein
MREIYEKAHKVIIFPGANRSARLAADMVYQLYDMHLRFQGSPLEFYLFAKHDKESARWLALMQLAKNYYFSRVWIIQEVAMAKNPQIFYGGLYIPWDIFVLVVSECMESTRRVLMTASSQPGHRILDQSFSISNIAAITLLCRANREQYTLPRMPGPIRPTLAQLLEMSIHFKASWHSDQIIALYGLADQERCRISDINDLQRHRSPRAVYTDVAKCILQSSEGISILAHAGTGYRRRLSKLPTWVPDWSRNPPNEPFMMAMRLQQHALLAAFMFLSPRFRVEFQDKTMLVKGTRIDRIVAIGGKYGAHSFNKGHQATSNEKHLHTTRQWHSLARRLANVEEGVYPDSAMSRAEVFWRTLIGNCTEDLYPAPPEYESFYNLWSKGLNLNPGDEEVYFETYCKDPQVRANCRVFGNRFVEACLSRRFFVTNEKRFGLAQPRTRVGDVVCSIVGDPTPFILRPNSDGTYELVGQCYMHGGMMWEQSSIKKPVEIFRVR